MRILFIGDIVGKIGRKALALALPEWRQKHEPDLVIANAENIAHGLGVTPQTLEEVRRLGVDFFTTGNHWADKSEGIALFGDQETPIIRPANWPGKVIGSGCRIIEAGATPVAIVNLLGQLFTGKLCDSPFHKLDEVLESLPPTVRVIIVDFQAEATSEKQALGYYAAGRVSAVLGTHTHVPTLDVRVLPPGTAYTTDIGMVGAVDSVIGDRKEEIIARFLDLFPRSLEVPESGLAQVNAVLVEVEAASGRATAIERLDTAVVVT